MATLQQRLVDAQQSMEREYAKLRQAETRYRLLFQISSEAVLVVDSANDRIVEANPAACKLIGKAAKRLTGKQLHELFNAEGAGKIQAQLASVRASGRADEIRTRLAGAKHDVVVTASMYRQETTAHFLIRLLSPDAAAAADQRQKSSLHDVMQQLPDGFVVTDLDRRILMANQAFLDMVQATAEEQVRSEPIERWLGRHAVDVTVLVKNVRNRGAVRNFASVVRGEYGSQENVEISAVFVDAPEQSCYGFTIRNVIEEADAADNRHPALPRSVEQLTELVGRVALKDLVREATDVIERLCIEAALELTGDNRASAAEMLGLSRQGLYSKLRRHGLGDIGEAR
jgi:transcriptional regulator PpsR